MEIIATNYWSNVVFNGSEVRAEFRNCLSQETPFNDYKVVHKVINVCYQNVFLNYEILCCSFLFIVPGN